jgi:ankyrin repeat protein
MSRFSRPAAEDFAGEGEFSKLIDAEKFAIIWCSDLDKSEQLSLLSSIKIDMNTPIGKVGNDPIFYYVLKKYYSPDVKSVFKSFVESGANVNARCSLGIPLLHMFVHDEVNNHDKDIIEFLLENGADVCAEWTYQNDSSHHRIYNTFDELFKILENDANIGIFTDIAKLLIDRIDINHRFSDNLTILMRAVCYDEVPVEIINYILKAGADVQLKDRHDNTALHHSTYRRSYMIDVMKLLIANGADVDAVNIHNHGNSPLMMVIDRIRDGTMLEAIKLLILAGANVNHKNSRGQTALSMACGAHSRFNPNMSNVILELINAGAIIEHDYKVSSKILMVVLNDLRQTKNKLLDAKTDLSNTIVAFASRDALSKKRAHVDDDDNVDTHDDTDTHVDDNVDADHNM